MEPGVIISSRKAQNANADDITVPEYLAMSSLTGKTFDILVNKTVFLECSRSKRGDRLVAFESSDN